MSERSFSPMQILCLRWGAVVAFMLFLYVGIRWAGVTPISDDTVTVYAFADTLSPEVFSDFEKETGITVNLRYFEAAEELLPKLLLTGESDVDVIAPNDAMAQVLAEMHVLSPLRYDLLPSHTELLPALLNKLSPTTSCYAAPYVWAPIAIAYDSRFVPLDPKEVTWELVFGKTLGGHVVPPSEHLGVPLGRVCMGEDPWETVFSAGYHLFGRAHDLSDDQCSQIVQLLRQQKAWVESYTNNLRYFLISGISHVAIMPAAYVIMMREEYPWVEFATPASGNVLFCQCLAIPKVSTRKELAHKVIEFLISRRGGNATFNEHAFFSANRLACADLPAWIKEQGYLLPSDRQLAAMYVEHNQVPPAQIEQMWYDIKR